jgi:hypothetical protein
MKKSTLFGLVIILAFLIVPAVTFVSADDTGYVARGKPPSVTVTITSPSNGATVSGVVTITVDSSVTPDIIIDGATVAEGTSYDWDTTTVSDGDHTIKAKYRGSSDEIIVTVANGGGEPDPDPIPDPDPDPTPTGNKLALVIGISDYEGTSSDLTYCDDDAMDWKNYFQGEGYSVTTLLNSQATADNIEAALMDLAAAEQAGDLVAVTYSGHGYYDRGIRQSGWVSHDLYLLTEDYIEAITDTFDSTAVFWFNDCCNIGTYANLANDGWVMGVGSAKNTYTYDGTADMQNGIYTYFAMEAIALGYNTAEAICNYAADMFNAATPGRASTVDNYSGDLVL